MSEEIENKPSNFIKNIIDADLAAGKIKKIVTRFPPEPNGFLHIGHSNSICLNWGLAKEYDGVFHLRFDDTNPEKEDIKFVDAIKKDIEWLGCDWKDNLFFTSSYFDQLYEFAVELIKNSKAFVCDLNPEEMREARGNFTTPGRESPHRNRTIEENLDLFERMKNGDFADGSKTLRAKIDMQSPNMNMRDPAIYRIKNVSHPLTGDKWKIYPMYDFAHGLSDAIEGITHSICTLEFEDHRPLYDWYIDNVSTACKPQQIEFAKLYLEGAVIGKRHIKRMVDESVISGWDDPRLLTIAGMRNRGYTPESIRHFNSRIGITKSNSSIAMAELENAVRSNLEEVCPRVLAVIDPLKVTITNFLESKLEIDCKFHPKNESFGTRKVPFSNEIYIERSDFEENPPPKFHRLKPGGSVRLRYAYVIDLQEIIKDETGKVIELKCTYNQDTFGGKRPEGMKKVKGIINWVSAGDAIPVETRLYDRLFTVANPMADKDIDFLEFLNPNSLETKQSFVEPSLSSASVGDRFQFERQGYFIKTGEAAFNRTITLRDNWAKK